MTKGISKWVWAIMLPLLLCIYTYGHAKTIKAQIYDSELLQSGRFNSALSGLTNVDFLATRHTLLSMQSEIHLYPKNQQAHYWYYLAISGWKLGLSSEHVIPSIEQSLSFRDSIEDYELFQILMNAKNMTRDYGHFHHVIKFIDNIKRLVGKRPNTNDTVLVSPVDADYAIAHYKIGENHKAIVYLQNLISLTVISGDKPVRYWFQILTSAQELTGDTAGAIETLKKQIALYPHKNSVAYLKVLENTLIEPSV